VAVKLRRARHELGHAPHRRPASGAAHPGRLGTFDPRGWRHFEQAHGDGIKVAVQVDGRNNAGLPHDPLEHLGRLPRLDHQRGARTASVIRLSVPDSSSSPHRPSHLRKRRKRECLLAHAAPVRTTRWEPSGEPSSADRRDERTCHYPLLIACGPSCHDRQTIRSPLSQPAGSGTEMSAQRRLAA
jgi:hypothetical protein